MYNLFGATSMNLFESYNIKTAKAVINRCDKVSWSDLRMETPNTNLQR